MTDLKKAEEYIFSHKDDIINDLFTLCRIPSVQGEPEPDAPFGAEPKNALIAAEKLFSEAGCTTALHPAYLVSGFGNGEKTIGIFSHADVVPADGDWKKTEPFSPVMLGDWPSAAELRTISPESSCLYGLFAPFRPAIFP